jgi:hypothetical protein
LPCGRTLKKLHNSIRSAFSAWLSAGRNPYPGNVKVENTGEMDASLAIHADAKPGQTIHIICEVTDNGTPPLTRSARVIMTVAW